VSDHDPDFELLCDLAREEIAELSVHDVHAIMGSGESVLVIDVREDHEWAEDHVAGATHLGRGILERDIRKHVASKDAELVLYCGGGYRSALAALNLQRMGYSRVASMAGGIKAWRAEGFPLSTD
jgi:rhodanese-related sulfurtransferase